MPKFEKKEWISRGIRETKRKLTGNPKAQLEKRLISLTNISSGKRPEFDIFNNFSLDRCLDR